MSARVPSIVCIGCGWSVELPFISPGRVSIEAADGWEIIPESRSVLCERCSKGWKPAPPSWASVAVGEPDDFVAVVVEPGPYAGRLLVEVDDIIPSLRVEAVNDAEDPGVVLDAAGVDALWAWLGQVRVSGILSR